eukprot:gene5943-biopygen8347
MRPPVLRDESLPLLIRAILPLACRRGKRGHHHVRRPRALRHPRAHTVRETEAEGGGTEAEGGGAPQELREQTLRGAE